MCWSLWFCRLIRNILFWIFLGVWYFWHFTFFYINRPLQQGYRYNALIKIFTKFYHNFRDLSLKYYSTCRNLITGGNLHQALYRNIIYKSNCPSYLCLWLNMKIIIIILLSFTHWVWNFLFWINMDLLFYQMKQYENVYFVYLYWNYVQFVLSIVQDCVTLFPHESTHATSYFK